MEKKGRKDYGVYKIMTHLDNIEKLVGRLDGKKILDIGSGRGEFLIACILRKYNCRGIELEPDKIRQTLESAKHAGVSMDVVKGEAERLPFPDNEFDFVNVCEVLEHVKDTGKVLNEISRVLKKGGIAYLSAHNRFGIRDTHFRLYFIGWMPRSLANFYLTLRGRHKNYEDGLDLQRLDEMHYFTFRNIAKILRQEGFNVEDIRERRIKTSWAGVRRKCIMAIYRFIMRPFYFSTFHLLLTKDHGPR